MARDPPELTLCITPFFSMRQYYYAIERDIVSSDDLSVNLEYRHSPHKDHVLVCGDVDATTMSMGKYVLAKSISHTYTLPTDPFAVSVESVIVDANGLFAPADSEIDEPADLVGKRLGFHDKSLSLTYHKAVLQERYDVPVDEIEWVFDTHQGLSSQIEAGTIDAVERVSDWFWSLRNSPEYTELYSLGQEWHKMHGYHPMAHVIAVDRSEWAAHPRRYRALLDLLDRSKAYRDEHYDEILEEFVGEGGDLDEWSGPRSKSLIQRMTDGLHVPFTMDETNKRNITDWIDYAEEFGVLNRSIPPSELYP